MTSEHDQPAVRVIAFDWGGTLMTNDPAQRGRMVDWPTVEAIPGAAEALGSLAGRYRLVVVTGAKESRAVHVLRALARVGLDGFFEAVFTANEIGRSKRDPAFYPAVQSVLGLRGDQLLMVGDDPLSDAFMAHRAGWRTAWLNPASQPARALRPVHDLDLLSLADLPAALERPFLPDYETALAWLIEDGAPANLLAHVEGVAAAAYALACRLRARGVGLDPLLVDRGGLLHDIAKIPALLNRQNHGEMGARRLLEREQPALAEIARRHMLYCLEERDCPPRTWEEKLVYFADKLVEGGALASLEKRVEALAKRYPQERDRILAMTPALMALQAEISQAAGLSPDDLPAALKEDFFATSAG